MGKKENHPTTHTVADTSDGPNAAGYEIEKRFMGGKLVY